jgi:hypothetical protein
MPTLRANVAGERVPVRGTQSFVHTLSGCWQRPGWTGLELLWRWLFGLPALWLVGSRLKTILAAHTHGTYDLAALGLDHALLSDPVGALTADPMGAVGKLTRALATLLPDAVKLAVWLGPLLLAVWVVVSSIGRTVVLRHVDRRLVARPGTLMLLQAIRMAALAGTLALWWASIQATARVAVTEPIAAGQEPELVLYCALTIVASLGLFTLWAVVSWVFSVAPLLAMLRGLGAAASLRAAFRLGPLRSELVEINLVMGIVKIALLVLAMVFSASPLPFEAVASQGFLLCWWAAVTLLYLLGADFFHVVRLSAYLDLWRAFEGKGASPQKM